MRILIANRGEIARRVIRTAHRLGHETVSVFADPDRDAPFVAEATRAVRLGPADLASSYLSAESVLAAASQSVAEAVHPGYGFLSENAEFARSVIEAGLVWIGPGPEVIGAMGSKIEARRLAQAAGVPVIPGYDGSQDRAELETAAAGIGYPVLIKASAGGGGKGIRIARSPGEFPAALEAASTEALRAFGDSRVIVERFIERPRHIEVQVVGDHHGTVIDLGTRECSVQRRYQKLLEEAPAPNLPDMTRKGLREAARALADAIGYDSAGTVEFIVDDAGGGHFFLEMNTRLQVEHPVTEQVTGLDLVELQIMIAMGEPLAVLQDEVALSGHSIEARINAEDAFAGFIPQTGTVRTLRVPDDVRWDAGIEEGSVVSPFYDPMLAKLIVTAADRDEALAHLGRALDELLITGVTTNGGFHRWLVDQPQLRSATLTTRFLDETEPAAPDHDAVLDLGAALWLAAWDRHRKDAPSPWQRLSGMRLTPHRPWRRVGLRPDNTTDVVEREVGDAGSHVFDGHHLSWTDDAGDHRVAATVDLAGRALGLNVAGQSHGFAVVPRIERWAGEGASGGSTAGALVSPFPALVTEVRVSAGDDVAPGDVIVVIEAMKMLHSLNANGHGTIAEVRVAVGDQVKTNQVLILFEDHAERTTR